MQCSELQASTTQGLMYPSRRLVLTSGLASPLKDVKLDTFRIVPAEGADDILHVVTQERVSVLVLGSLLKPTEAFDILTRLASESAAISVAAIVLCAGSDPELFQKFVDEGQIFFLTRGEISTAQLASLVVCSANRLLAEANRDRHPLVGNTTSADRLLDLCVRLPMQADILSAGRLLVETLRDFIDVSDAQCVVYDGYEETLTPVDALDDKECSYSPASGLVAYVARTGECICLDRIGIDPRYDCDIDNRGGREDARFVAQPILGLHGTPVAVITAARTGDSEQFSTGDARLVEFLAECAAPTFSQILLQNRMQAQLTKQTTSGSNSAIFRQEALEYHIRSWNQHGDVLKTLPAWLQRAYWIMLVLFFVGLLGLTLLIPGVRDILQRVM